jgi:nicotinamidase-related amidase
MATGDANAAALARSAPGGVGVLVIDMINDLDFHGAVKLRAKFDAVADVVLALRAEADRLGAPTVYVNDNFGQWHSDRDRIVEACVRGAGEVGAAVRRVAPRPDDYFVIKPQFSGFYATNLPVLLPRLGVSRLVLTGVAADICVLFTAGDAHMREYDLWVPVDAVASEDDQRRDWALGIMKSSMGADCRPTSELTLADWIAAKGRSA